MTQPRIGVALISDRGALHVDACQASYRSYVHGPIADWHLVDDRDHRLGLAGAVQEAWAWALDAGVDYLFHLEEDFRFARDVRLDLLVARLQASPYLAQVCLIRQPWSPEERAVGGVYATAPGEYQQMGNPDDPYSQWVLHRRGFSLNPCLIPRAVLEIGWPSGPIGVGNETGFTHRCLDRGLAFAYAGRLDDDPWVHHVGDTRGEGWKL